MVLAPTTKSKIFAVFGIIFFVLGNILAYYWPSIMNTILLQRLILQEGSETTYAWTYPQTIIHAEIYFFNCTNTNEVLQGSPPEFKEVGPYVFRETRTKEDVIFNDNDTVSYYLKSYYYFEPDLSNGTVLDKISSINVPVLVAANKLRYQSTFAKYFGSKTLGMMSLFQTKTVEQLLFKGYPDPILKMKSFVSAGPNGSDRFGWFYGRNGTVNKENHFNVHTGKDDTALRGLFHSYQYKDNNSYFPEPCNSIGVSAGEFWPPHIPKENLTFYPGSMCRVLNLPFEREDVTLDVDIYRFSSDEDFFNNNGSCYCGSDEFATCLPVGAHNLSACKDGAPMFISQPHFLNADPSYTEGIIGMEPDYEKHKFYFDIEPVTSTPVTVAARFQFNIYLSPIPGMSMFKKVPTVFFPVFWMATNAVQPEEMAAKLAFVGKLPTLGYCVAYVILGLGVLFLFIFAALHIPRKNRSSKNSIKKEKQPESIQTKEYTKVPLKA